MSNRYTPVIRVSQIRDLMLTCLNSLAILGRFASLRDEMEDYGGRKSLRSRPGTVPGSRRGGVRHLCERRPTSPSGSRLRPGGFAMPRVPAPTPASP